MPFFTILLRFVMLRVMAPFYAFKFCNLMSLSLMVSRPFALISLALLAIGTGGIKPCVVSFGADQGPML